MATFLATYQARFSTELRTNWSNPQGSAATTPNTTLEGLADTDIVGEFLKRGITADNTLAAHVTTAMGGLIARLMFYCQCPGWETAWSAFQEDVKLLAETTSRDRIVPSTDGLLAPSYDNPGDLPTFDPQNFQNYTPNAPNGPSPLLK